MISSSAWIVAVLLSWHVVHALVDVPLRRISYSYVGEVEINGSSQPFVMDTGSSQLITFDSYSANISRGGAGCLALVLDTSYAVFFSPAYSECTQTTQNISLGGVDAEAVTSHAQSLWLQNALLHNWTSTAGVLGLSYNQSCFQSPCGSTAFQELIASAALSAGEREVFGLDLRPSGDNSSVQLGGVSPAYADGLQWVPQPVSRPYNHEIMLEDLRFCGTALFANYSTTWNAIVDTGSTCLSLPAEIYDSFAAWFDNSTVVDDLSQLPAFSFSLPTGDGSSSKMYLPLGLLAVNADAVEGLNGAPSIFLSPSSAQSAPQKLCVLRGSTITSEEGRYLDPPPMISLGSLALQTLYFAANFSSKSTAFASKLTQSEIALYSQHKENPFCTRQRVCVGDETYSTWNNECEAPRCDGYFFVKLDSKQQVCVFDMGAFGFGIALISLIMAMEVVSFLLQQYTGHTLTERSRGSAAMLSNVVVGAEQARPLENAFKIDPITLFFAKIVTCVVDWLLQLDFRGRFRQRPLNNNNNNPPMRLPAVEEHVDA